MVLCGKLFPEDERVSSFLNCDVFRTQIKFNGVRFSELLKGKKPEYLRLT